MLKKLGLPALLVAAMLALNPAAALARDHGEGGRGYSLGQSFSGRSYSGGHGYYGRREYAERRGDHDRDRYHRGGGFGFGLGFYGAPYAYQPGCGYYDRWGYWQPTPCPYPGY
jgi:hypothetical protein